MLKTTRDLNFDVTCMIGNKPAKVQGWFKVFTHQGTREDEGHGYSCGTVVPRGGGRIINFLKRSREGSVLEKFRGWELNTAVQGHDTEEAPVTQG